MTTNSAIAGNTPMSGRTPAPITCLFLDIGGVLLTDGWNHHTRARAAAHFDLDAVEMERRHGLVFDGYERDEMTLDRYLELVIFHEARTFTAARMKSFMFQQSKAIPQMIELFVRLKARHQLQIIVVSNEARELNAHRIHTFALSHLVDAFVSSCFVQMRKPDIRFFRLALDIAQASAAQVLFIENTAMHLQVAATLGIPGILHTDWQSTRAQLAACGLPDDGDPE
jgi:HAD superfamily hydrolase (TIGR01509 family)